jgi:hypothetical protein
MQQNPRQQKSFQRCSCCNDFPCVCALQIHANKEAVGISICYWRVRQSRTDSAKVDLLFTEDIFLPLH